MAITINWATKVINVPQADLTPLGGSIYELNLDTFRKALKALEASEEGMPELDTHQHNTEVTVSGTTLARVIEIINGYTISFEETGTPYAINLVAANSNVADVTNVSRDVSTRSFNTAGLQIVSVGSGLSQAQNDELFAIRTVVPDNVWEEDTADHTTAGTFGARIVSIPTSAENADAVWDEVTAGHTTAGTFGARISDIPTVAQIADSVWNEVAAGHTTVGTTGASLRDAALAKQSGVAVVTGPYATGQVLAKDSVNNQVLVFLRLNADHFTPATGLAGDSMTVRMSKNGGPMAIITPTVSETGLGWYSLALTAGMCDTLGPMMLMVSHSTTDTWAGVLEIDVRPNNTPGAVTAVRTPSTTPCSTTLTGEADQWKDSYIRFTTGVLTGQVRFVTGFATEDGLITYEDTTKPPGDGDSFVLINS